MRLTVLGKSPAWEDAGGACSGYLVEEGDSRLLLECGNGVFGKLRERMPDYSALDAVLVSHLHADHWLDLIPFSYALNYSPSRVHSGEMPIAGSAGPALWGPPGSLDAFGRVTGAWGSEELLATAFEVNEYEPDGEVSVRGISVTFQPVPHYIETYAISLVAADGSKIVHGADCRPNIELIEFAKGADLLTVEATLAQHGDEPEDERGLRAARDAGELARKGEVGAGLRRLVADGGEPV
ncbi:MAG: MBL fold metallo-hydrolase, partial [bacterium]